MAGSERLWWTVKYILEFKVSACDEVEAKRLAERWLYDLLGEKCATSVWHESKIEVEAVSRSG